MTDSATTADTSTEREAGRELDALIAEALDYEVRWRKNEWDGWMRPVHQELRSSPAFAKVPRWSSHMDSAWYLVRHMAERGFWLKLSTPFTPDEPYHAGFTKHGVTGWNGRPDFAAAADSAPLAICLAALAALSDSHP